MIRDASVTHENRPHRRGQWLLMWMIAISGWMVGTSTFAQLERPQGVEDQIFHDRFEGEPNQPPILSPVPDQVAIAEALFTYQLEAVDPWPPHDRVGFQLDVAPAGMTVDTEDGLINWVPSVDQQGKHPVVARAFDRFGGFDLAAFQITVIGPDNRPPVLEPIGDRTLRTGQVFSIQPVASDPDLPDDVLSFSLSDAPPGLSLATASGGITWAPSEAQLGQWPMTLTVTDLGGLSDSTSFTITVLALGSPPSIEAIPDQTLLVGELLDITAQATDPDLPDDELTFSLTRAPQGMAINATKGRITWTPGPDRVGGHDVTVEVRDQVGLLDETPFVVRVTQPNRAPVALNDEYRARRGETTTIDAPGVMANDSDPDGDPMTAELLSGPSRGLLDFRADGSFDYTPGRQFLDIEAVQVASFQAIEIGSNSPAYWPYQGEFVVGDLSGDGRSEIVSMGQIGAGGGIHNTGWLVALSLTEADELELLWAYDGSVHLSDFAMSGGTSLGPALGDVTGDGRLEVIAPARCPGEILIFSHLGEPLVSTQVGMDLAACVNARNGRPTLVDLTADGHPEILTWRYNELRAFAGNGDLLWATVVDGFFPGSNEYSLSVADVNLDGRPNIWFGGALLDADGNILWNRAPLAGGSNRWLGKYAVANLNDDPFAELIYFGVGPYLKVLDHEGNCLWNARQSGTGNWPGCPPALSFGNLAGFANRHTSLLVADLLGDGQPKILVSTGSGQSNYVTVFNADGSILWQVETLFSSGLPMVVNEIQAFDLNGDSRMEVIATGLRGTLFLSGEDGSRLFEIAGDTTHPGLGVGGEDLRSKVVDLDGDGRADLVMASGNYSAAYPNGVFVYRDVANRWMPARSIWHQYDTSVTNINADGSVPSPARPNWLDPGLNNYRINALPVAERVGAVQVASFSEMTIDGNSSNYRVNRGTVVAADLNGDGRSELISIGQRGGGGANTQHLTVVALTEDDELELQWFWNGWRNANPVLDPNRDFAMRGARDPVVGDLTGDGVPEIVVTAYCLGDILIFSNTGERLVSTQVGRVPQSSETSPDCPQFYESGSAGDRGRLSLIDLSGDGLPEILLSFRNRLRAFDGSGALLWEAEAPNYQPGSAEFDYAVADVNLDGRPNIWFGGTLFDADGNVLWGKATSPLSNDWIGWYAVANLNDDPYAELIYWGGPHGLVVFDHLGQCLWQARGGPNPQPTLGCPPVTPIPDSVPIHRGLIVADIAGDGKARIVVGSRANSDGQSANRVLAFDPDGALFWSVPALLSSGASIRVNQVNAFDLTGNGRMEVVVTGLNGTVVLDGRNGQILFEMPGDATNPGLGSAAGQDILYSIIVDLDGDGAAELVLASQAAGGVSGLFVYRHPQNRWMPARGIWNQWAYSVTNVNPDLSIPSPAERNWLTRGLNNYGINGFMPGEGGALDTFSYRVSDGDLYSNEATVYIDIRRPNRPPAFISSPIIRAAAGLDYRYRVLAVDPDPGDEVSLSFNQGPAGMTFGSDQVLRWQPGMADLGEHSIILSAIDLEGEISLQEFVLEVVEPVAVPDVLGLAQNDAEAALVAAGFQAGRISERFDEDFAAGLVAGQQPGAGSLQVPGKRIDLTVSKGPAPVDDSTPPEFPVEAILVDPGELNLLTGESFRLKAFAEFADGSTQLITRVVNWSSDSAVASVNTNGRLTAVSGGAATISAEIDGVVGQALVQVTARDPADDEGPVALISVPGSGQVVFEPVEIIGTAFDEQLVRYELALSPAGEGLWTPLGQGTSNVEDGVLGVFDPTVLLNGFYDIRLRVLDAGGNERTDEITVQADGEQKAGLFTLAFTDLSLPVGGLPVGIERVYDSRDRSMGDFGMGWRLGLRSIELKCASRLGEDWFVARSGLSFSLLPMREKACAISLPGGRMEVFDFQVTPSNSPFVPFLTVTGQLKPRPGTLGQIEILDNTNFLILDPQPGEVRLYDDATFNPFNPVELRYTMPDGTVFEFTHGRVSRVVDLNGNSLEFSLDGIEHSSGIGVDFERDVLGRITAITDPSGHTQTYAYSANGDLASHTDVLGNTTRFFYNSRHGLVRIEDPLGNSAIRSEYDARGRLIAVTDAAGNRTEHSYDDEARLQTTIFPDGSVRTVAYDDRGYIEVQSQLVTIDGQLVFTEESWEYDDFGNPTRAVDADGVVEQAEWNEEREWTRRAIDPDGLNLVEEQDFDDEGRAMRFVDAMGRERGYQYDLRGNVTFSPGPGGVSLGMAYDSAGRLAGMDNPLGERVHLEYNGAGQLIARETRTADGLALIRTEFELDANGRLMARREVALHGETSSRTTVFERDAMGRLMSLTNPLGETTSFEYDAVGNITAIVDPLGARTEMDYDARGLMIERRRADGGVETVEHDFAGRPVRSIDADGVVFEIEYDELGRAVAQRSDGQLLLRRIFSPGGRLLAEIDALGHRTDHEYDSAGRLVRIRMPEVFDPVSSSLRRPEVEIETDSLGRQTAVTDPLGRRTEYVYDEAGYLSRVIHPDGSERQHTFDAAGRHQEQADEEGHSTLFEYDAAGRMTRVLQPAPAPGEPRPETRYVYDSFGQLRSRIDAMGRVSAFEYDGAGRVTRKIMPDGSSRATEYDGAGRAVRVVDFDGTVLDFTHDPLGRLLSRSAAGLLESVDYTPGGRRAEVSDGRGLTSFAYDGQGRMASFVQSDGLGIDYEYDGNGRITSITVDGQTTSYGWDAMGRLVSVTTAAGTTSYEYDLAGQLRREILPNGVVRLAEYDERGRPLNVALRAADDSLLESFASTFSPRGKQLSLTTSDGASESFEYDPIGRLVEVTRTGQHAYALSFDYDPVGNRLRQVWDGVETLYSYGLNDQLLSAGGDSFSYDARGNRTAAVVNGEAVSFQWDAFGRLSGAVTPDGAVQFDNDIDGQRVGRVQGDQRVGLLVDPLSVGGFSQVVAEFDASAQVLARWDYGRQVISQHRDGQVHHYGHDHRGSVGLLTDEAGQISNRYSYLPFGDSLAASGVTPNPYRFNGERWESAARSYDFRARSYDSCSGTFLSRDPFPGFQDQPLSLNRYLFAGADPVNHVDPMGLFLIELNLVQFIQTNLRNVNFVSAAKALCTADNTLQWIQLAVVAGEVMGFVDNLRHRRISQSFTATQEFTLQRGATMAVSASGAVGMKGLSMTFGVGIKPKSTSRVKAAGGSLSATWSGGQVAVNAALSYTWTLSACGHSIASATVAFEGSEAYSTGPSGGSSGKLDLLLSASLAPADKKDFAEEHKVALDAGKLQRRITVFPWEGWNFR